MGPLHFLIISVVCFAFLRFIVIPFAERQLKFNKDSFRGVALHALLSICEEILKPILKAFIASTVTIMLALTYLLNTGGTSTLEMQSTIATLTHLHSIIDDYRVGWSVIFLGFIIVIFTIDVYRSANTNMYKIQENIKTQERLSGMYDHGQLESLPPTDDMIKIQKLLTALELAYKDPNIISNLPEEMTLKVFSQKALDEIDHLKSSLKQLDIQRRMKGGPVVTQITLPQPHSIWEKVQVFFISRGLLKSLGRVTFWLFAGSYFLWIPASLGIYSQSINQNIDTKIADLTNTIIGPKSTTIPSIASAASPTPKMVSSQPTTSVAPTTNNSGASQTIVPVNTSPIQSTPLPVATFDANQQALVDKLVRIYEKHLTLQYVKNLEQLPYDFRSTITRNYIIDQAETEHLHGFPDPISPDQQQEAVIKIVGDSNTHDTSLSSREGQIRALFERELSKNPELVKKLQDEINSFAEQEKPESFMWSAVDNITNIFFSIKLGGVWGDLLNGLVAKTFEQMTPKGSIKSTTDKFTQLSSRFINRLIDNLRNKKSDSNESIGEALDSVNSSPEFLETRALIQKIYSQIPINEANIILNQNPPSLRVDDENNTDYVKLAEKIIAYYKQLKSSVDPQSANLVAGYENWFPAQDNPTTNSPRDQLVQNLNIVTNLGDIDAKQARDFQALAGSSHVGGVLIGRNPSTPNNAIADLSWDIVGSSIIFTITDNQGNNYRSVPYPLDIAYEALLYAADGRQTTVTGIGVPPLPDLKILLHPALVDTPLGNEFIELDYDVFKILTEDSEISKAIEIAYAYDILYQRVWADRILAIRHSFLPQYKQLVQNAHEILNFQNKNEDLSRLVKLGLDHIIYITDPVKSPMAFKTEFYDQSILQLLSTYDSNETFNTSLKTFDTWINLQFAYKRNSDDWLVPPAPAWGIASQIGERTFSGEINNLIVTDWKNFENPFDFSLRVAFLPPSDTEPYIDLNPWKFPSVPEDYIRNVISVGLKKYGDNTKIADATQFTLLQRLFRTILYTPDSHFPVEKLATLMDKLKPYRPTSSVTTKRWIVDP